MHLTGRLRTAPGTGLARAICPLSVQSPLPADSREHSQKHPVPQPLRCRCTTELVFFLRGHQIVIPKTGWYVLPFARRVPLEDACNAPVPSPAFPDTAPHACAPGFGSKVQSVLCSHGKVAIAERQSGRATRCLRMNRFAVSLPIAPASQRGQGCFDRGGRKFVGWT